MYNEDAAVNGLIALFGGALIFVILIVVAAVVFQIIAMVKVYKKAGKDGWEAIVPYYNIWVLCELAEVKWWFFLVLLSTTICGVLGLVILEPLAAIASLAGFFAVNYNIAKKFGKDPVGYGIGLTLLPIVFYAILGFGDAEFKNVKVSAYGPIDESQIEKKQPTEPKKTDTENPKFCKSCGAEVADSKFCPNCGAEIHK